MIFNSIYNEDCISGMGRRIPDESVDLVIADPPYFKTINQKWDYAWSTEDDYLQWTRKWAEQAYKSLRLGGSFYVFGYFRTLALMVPELESIGFKLRQQIIINKGLRSVSGRATKNYKMYPNVTESILFFIKDPIPYSRALLKSRQKKLGLTAKFINEAMGAKSNGGGMWSIYTGRNMCEQLPTRSQWDKLQSILDFDVPYDEINVTFNTQMGVSDVWSDIDFTNRKRIHPTQKPEELIERIIITSSNPGDFVVDPFMGSGTTAVVSQRNNRRWLGFELDRDYWEASRDRLGGVFPNSTAPAETMHYSPHSNGKLF